MQTVEQFLRITLPKLDDSLRVSTLHQLSKDDEGNHLTEHNEKEAYSLDAIIRWYSDNKNLLMSADAVVINKEKSHIIFIEFKNRKVENNQTKKDKRKEMEHEIRLKALESSLCLGIALNEEGLIGEPSLIYRYRFKFVVVYSANKNPNLCEINMQMCERMAKMQTNNTLRNRSVTYKVLFNLEKYQNRLYDKVLTLDSKSFDENIHHILN